MSDKDRIKKVVSVIVTRPEAIKMAPIIQKLVEAPEIESIVVATAQHRQMLDQVLELFEIEPDVDLNLMKPNQTLAGVTAAIFTELDPVLRRIQPDWVLAQGDTTTVMATALLAYYNRIKFGHVEAGLRTGDKLQPFPEEVNRMVAGVVADLHFAPTAWSKNNLLLENVPEEKIRVTGNSVIDALELVENKEVPPEIASLIDEIGNKRILLITAHRRENFGQPLENICTALETIAEMYRDQIHLVYPVHRNPNVRGVVEPRLGGIENISLLEPLDYLPMVQLMKHSYLVLTDSGGIQEEAPYFGLPVLVMRSTTERPEGVDAGTVRLVGTKTADILAAATTLLDDTEEYSSMARSVNPYGDGKTSARIIQALLEA